MNQEQARAILKKAFKALAPEHIENFRYHLRNETPVFCGVESVKFRYFNEHGHG